MDFKQKLIKRLKKRVGTQNVELFSSCRNAIFCLIKMLDFKKEDEVIVQSFICDTIPQTVNEAGATAIAVDVDESTYNLSAEKIKKHLTKNTKAVIFVHTYGNPTGIHEVKALCKEHNLILIEDVAQALGAKHLGKPVGSIADYAVYSLTKQLVNIGGGAMFSNNDISKAAEIRDQLHKPARAFIDYPKRLIASLYDGYGFIPSKWMIDYARNRVDLKLVLALDRHFKCSEVEAFLSLIQLYLLDSSIKRRKRNFEYIQKYVKTQEIETTADSAYTYLSFRFPNKEVRDLAVKDNFYFLPPWKGTAIGDKLIFAPNNPYFPNFIIRGFCKSYRKAFNQFNSK